MTSNIITEMSKTLGVVLVLQYRWVKNWYWNWYCIQAFWWSGIGIGIVYTGFKELVCLGIGIGIVYTMSEKLVLELELFNLRLKNWYELALELELFKQWLKNWYCIGFCLSRFSWVLENWYWSWYWIVSGESIGTGIGAKKVVLLISVTLLNSPLKLAKKRAKIAMFHSQLWGTKLKGQKHKKYGLLEVPNTIFHVK